MAEWIEQYGYWAVLLGTIVEGEATYLAGAVSARLTELNIIGIAFAGFIGGGIRDITIYTLSRRGAQMQWITQRIDKEKLLRVRNWIEARPFYLLIFHRYIYGFSTATIFILGVTQIPWSKFLTLTFFACLVWVVGYGLLGYFFTDMVLGWIGD